MIRYVRMRFRPEEVPHFLQVFEHYQEQIRAVPGCLYLALQQDLDEPNCWMTHSHWESPAHLESYRNSALFREVWAQTKVLFEKPAQAFSVENRIVLT